MPIYYDVTKDLRYQQGVEQGIEQGIEKGVEIGIEQGIEKGIERSNEKFIQALLKKGTFSLKEISELTGSDIDTVISVYKKMGLK